MLFKGKKQIGQLQPNRGAYYYIALEKEWVNKLSRKRATRLICTINERTVIRCGLNHLGDGNFFIIISRAHMEALDAYPSEIVNVEIIEDPNPLGVEEPAVLDIFLNEYPDAKILYDNLSDGKKRSLIFSIIKIKNVDIQINKLMKYFELL